MSKFEIDEYNIHGFNLNGKTTGKLETTCPFCSHDRKKKKEKCATVYLDTDYFKCHHCMEEGQIHKYKRSQSSVTYKKPEEKGNKQFPQEVLDFYKEHRGISEETLNDAPIFYTKEWMPKAGKEVPTIVYKYEFFGEHINNKYRAKNKDFKFESGCELSLYNIDNIKGKKEAIVVEGEEDVLAFWEAGYTNVVSVPNGFPKPSDRELDLKYLNDDVYEVFDNIDKIIIAVDNDENGRHGARELVRRFGAEKCYLIDFKEHKDASEYLVKKSKEELAQALIQAKPVPLDDVYTINDFNESLDNFWINGSKKGMTVDLPSLDKGYSIEWKQYTLLVAPPQSGKSDVVDHIALKLALKYDVKTAFCSIENEPFYFHYDKIYKKLAGRKPSRDEVGGADVNNIKDFIADNIYHVKFENRYKLDKVLAKFEELVKRKGVRFFVIDPFNKVRLDGVSRSDVNQYTEEYHIMIDEFCKKNDVHVFLVVHPTKMKKEENSNKYVMPDGYAIKGGGEHFDMSYNILGMVRDFEMDYVHMRTLKVKFQHIGSAGVDAFFKWNKVNGRFADFEDKDPTMTFSYRDFNFDFSNWITGDIDDEIERETIKTYGNNNNEIINNEDVYEHRLGDDDDTVPF